MRLRTTQRHGGWRIGTAVLLGLLVAQAGVADVYDAPIWDLEAVDADGRGTHPLVGAQDQVRFTGVVLNDPADMLNPGNPGGSGADAWQVYVQTLPDAGGNPQHGGIAVFAASPYYGGTPYTWPRYPTDFEEGDVVEVVGYVADFNGKVNLNERHDPYYEFTITHVQEGGEDVNIGLPEPFAIPTVADANYFDPTRAGGGELYQAQWATLEGVHVTGGTWGDGQQVVIADGSKNPDDSPATLGLQLGYQGFFGKGDVCDFSQYPAPGPNGKFNVTAIFNQEDPGEGGTYHGGYSMWPLQRSQLQYWGDADLDKDVDLVDAGTVYNHFTGANKPPAKTWSQGDFDGDQDVDLLDVYELLVNWTGALTGATGPMALAAADPGTACGTYDWTTGEIVLSASGIEYLRVDGDGLLTGDAPDWSFLSAGLTDDCDDFTGYWALGNPQTFTDQSIGDVAALGLEAGDLMLVYQADVDANQLSVPLEVVPEPATVVLLAAGGLALVSRRKPQEA